MPDDLKEKLDELMVPPEKQTPFEKATCAIMACGEIALNTNNLTDLDALEELILIQKADVQPYTFSFDVKKFELVLIKYLKKDQPALLENLRSEITACSTFYSEEL